MLFDHIGRGGMANIYLATEDSGLGALRRVVVKKILPRFGKDPDFARMLIDEAKLAAELRHANIVQVYDLGREGNELHIVMEYVEGFDLHQLLVRLSQSKVPLPAEFGLFIVRETLRALDYAHRARDAQGRSLGLIHRDVSPTNVLVSFEGEVKLCDFGIARAITRPEAHVDENTAARARVAGKAAYMSPEMARGEEVNARADIYAAGILLWELCAGRRLIKGTPQEMFAKAREGVSPRLLTRAFPDQDVLQAILDKALGNDPMDRYLTAADFLADVDTYCTKTRLLASPLRFGAFLQERFGDEIIAVRAARESAARTELRDSFPPPASGITDVSAVRRIPRTPVPPRGHSPHGAVRPPTTPAAPVYRWMFAVAAVGAAVIGLVQWLVK